MRIIELLKPMSLISGRWKQMSIYKSAKTG